MKITVFANSEFCDQNAKPAHKNPIFNTFLSHLATFWGYFFLKNGKKNQFLFKIKIMIQKLKLPFKTDFVE